MSVSIDGTNGLTFSDSTTQNTGGYTGFRNRIINGAMMIDQRNAGGALTIGPAAFSVDRWQGQGQTGAYSLQRNGGSVTPPAGFTNYLGATSLAATSLTSTATNVIRQHIEGFNIADLGWGTANAQSVTLSFWVRSSLTGTFGVALMNGAENYSYPASYTIIAANTWEYKTINVPAPTSGTWATDNTAGVKLWFGLGVGSTYSGTAGSWASATYYGTTGATSVVGTNGATFYITGVQLEKGTVATPFEFRQYGQELALCQRYYEFVRYAIGSVAGSTSGRGYRFPYRLCVDKRASPTVSISSSTTTRCSTPTASEVYASSVTLRTTNSNTDGDDFSATGSFAASSEL